MVLPLIFMAATHAPKWFDTTLAGYSLTHVGKHIDVFVHDPKSGFFVTRSFDCDGAQIGIELTRDHREVADSHNVWASGDRPDRVLEAPIPVLGTGKGVRIGDTPMGVESRLGAPTKVYKSGSRKQFVNYEYVFERTERREPTTYTERYTFKQGRLIEIFFFRDVEVGGLSGGGTLVRVER